MPPDSRLSPGSPASTDAEGATPPGDDADVVARFTALLRHHFDDASLVIEALHLQQRGSDHSIVNELTAWRRRHQTGLFQYRASLTSDRGAQVLDLFAKVKPADADVLAVAETVARTCDPGVHAELVKVRDRLGISGAQRRELEIYRLQHDVRLRAHMPLCYGTWQDEAAGSSGLLLEQLTDMAVVDSAGDLSAWPAAHVHAAVDGLAGIHAAGFDHAESLAAQPWIGVVPSLDNARRMTPFWSALAAHAAPMVADWAGGMLVATHRTLIDTVDSWWPALEAMPRTLVHHDFNSRNIGLRRAPGGPRLVAYDWELATVGAPQRDLAELLCFVLPPDVGADDVRTLIDRHRRALGDTAGQAPGDLYAAAFRSALADFLVSRLAFYALVHRVRPQQFLPRVLRTWTRLWETC